MLFWLCGSSIKHHYPRVPVLRSDWPGTRPVWGIVSMQTQKTQVTACTASCLMFWVRACAGGTLFSTKPSVISVHCPVTAYSVELACSRLNCLSSKKLASGQPLKNPSWFAKVFLWWLITAVPPRLLNIWKKRLKAFQTIALLQTNLDLTLWHK